MRGGFQGGMGGGYGNQMGGGGAPGGAAGGGRQLYISNVCFSPKSWRVLTCLQLPFNIGWQDLKDLFRGAGKSEPPFLKH